MRIAFFTDVYRPTVNGVVVSIDSYVTELRSLGHEVTIICPDYDDAVEEDGVLRLSAVTFPTYKEYRLASPISVRVDRFMKEHPQDIIHIHSPFTVGMLGMYYAKRLHIPLVYTAHTNYADYRHYVHGARIVPESAIDKLAAKFSNRVDLTIAPSKKISNSLAYHGTYKHVAVLPTGIPKLPRGSRARFRKTHDISSRHLMFVYLGRLTKEKNLTYLLDAFSHAQPRLHESDRLVLVGDGPYREELERYAEELGVRERVVFTGFLQGQDRADAFSAADVFCHVSHSETQGITLMEASYYGLPLLVSDDEAYRGVAVAGHNAVLVDDDAAMYGDQMVMLARNKEKRQRLGAEGKKLSVEFDISRQVETLIDLYSEQIREKALQENDDVVTVERDFYEKKATLLHRRTYYLQSGRRSKQKPTIVALHGFLSDGKSLVPALSELEYSGRLVVPDLPGFGASDSLKDSADHVAIDDFCDWLHAFLEKTVAKDEPVILLGYSFGAYVVTKYLASTRSKAFSIRRCVLVTPVVSIQAQVDFYTNNFLLLAKISEQIAARAWRMQHDFTTLYLSKSYRVQTKLNLIRHRKQELKFFNPELTRSLFVQIRGISLEGPVSAIDVPIDIILAGKDNIAQKKAIHDLMSHTKDIDVSWRNIPNAGHLAPMEHYIEVAREIDRVAFTEVIELSSQRKDAE